MTKPIPVPSLLWISNTPETAAELLDSGRFASYPIEADFPINSNSVAPFVTSIFDALAPLEAHEIPVGLISIKNGEVRVF